MPHRLVFDAESCAGFFSCVEVAPDAFERGDGRSELVGGREVRADVFEKEVGDEDLTRAIEAANVCPVDAIQVLDEEGRVVAGPETLPVDR